MDKKYIGKGSFGEVWRVCRTDDADTIYVAKCIELVTKGDTRAERLLKKFPHPNLLRVRQQLTCILRADNHNVIARSMTFS